MTFPVAIQLYSLRNFPPLLAQLPKIKAMGYDAVEPWLPAYEADPGLFARACRDAGLACHGFHMPLSGLRDEPQRYIDIALTLGARFLIPPWLEPHERGDWQRLSEVLQRGAELALPQGLEVLWHNHDFEYAPLPDGTRPIDHILQGEVGFEIDCGWIARAGADPAAELARYADKIRIIQTKDLDASGWAATGHGVIDWAALAPLMRQTRAHHLCTEHDDPADWQAFARDSLSHLRGLGL